MELCGRTEIARLTAELKERTGQSEVAAAKANAAAARVEADTIAAFDKGRAAFLEQNATIEYLNGTVASLEAERAALQAQMARQGEEEQVEAFFQQHGEDGVLDALATGGTTASPGILAHLKERAKTLGAVNKVASEMNKWRLGGQKAGVASTKLGLSLAGAHKKHIDKYGPIPSYAMHGFGGLLPPPRSTPMLQGGPVPLLSSAPPRT